MGANTNSTNPETLFSPRLCYNGYLCGPGDGEAFNNTKSCNMGSFCPITLFEKYCNNITTCIECLCPTGYYCPLQGMTTPSICVAGTYQPICGSSNCIDCLPGFYCNLPGIDQISVFMTICPSGFYCSSGSADKSLCTPGTYNPVEGQSQCWLCEKGFYCFTEGLVNGTICDKGYMCIEKGLNIPTLCPSGYFCLSGVSFFDPNISCPINEICPIICPMGHMCPSGSFSPTSCSQGSYQPYSGKGECILCLEGFYCPDSGLTYMINCTAGYYCNATGLAAPSGQCPAGYYCLEGTKSPVSSISRRLELFDCDPSSLYGPSLPNEPIPCPPSTYCSIGTSSSNINSTNGPKVCSSGYYNDRCGQGTCILCPDGFYCPNEGMGAPLVCPLGTYRSGYSIVCDLCPAGRWANNKQGLSF